MTTNFTGQIEDLRKKTGTSTVKMHDDSLASYKDLGTKGTVAFTKLQTDTTTTFEKLRKDVSSSVTKLQSDSTASFEKLRKDVSNSTISARDSASASIKKLQRERWRVVRQDANGRSGKQSKITSTIKDGTHQAAVDGTGSFQGLQDNITQAMVNGVSATATGTKDIQANLNNALKAFKGTPVPTVVTVSMPGASPKLKAASGALMQIGRPGDKGHDNIPLNVGGIPVLVGSGEQVAVLNASQQQYLNQRLAPEGGLPGFFQRVNKPHYMSSGGIVPRHAAAGSLVTASDFVAGPHTASGRTYIPGYAELSHNYGAGVGGDFSAMGHLPMGTMTAVTYRGKTVNIPKIDVGAGGPPLPPATIRGSSIDGSRSNARLLGLDNVTINIGGLGGAGLARRLMDRSQSSQRHRQGRGCRHRPGVARTRE